MINTKISASDAGFRAVSCLELLLSWFIERKSVIPCPYIVKRNDRLVYFSKFEIRILVEVNKMDNNFEFKIWIRIYDYDRLVSFEFESWI